MKKALAAIVALAFSYASMVRASDAVTVGIGNITNTYDSTSESFGLLRYLRQHHSKESPGLQFVLIDHPKDAPVSVSGSIGGTYRLSHEAPNFGIYMLLAMMGLIPGIVYLEAKKQAKFEYAHSIDLNFWRNGQKVASFKGPYGSNTTPLPTEVMSGEIWSIDPSVEQRERALAPLWALVSGKLNALAQER